MEYLDKLYLLLLRRLSGPFKGIYRTAHLFPFPPSPYPPLSLTPPSFPHPLPAAK
jgi:hypothetical protein